MPSITQKEGGVVIKIRVVPRASRSEFAGEQGDAIKVRIAAPPVEGAANTELVKLLAKSLGVAKSDIEIISGETSKTKLVRVTGVTAERVRTALHLSEPKSA